MSKRIVNRLRLSGVHRKIVKQFISRLSRKGPLMKNFEKIEGSCYYAVYVNKKIGLVVKRPSCLLDPPEVVEAVIPSVWVGGYLVQPVALRKRQKLAMRLILKLIGSHWCDLHEGNVGWYKDKPVMFDW